MLKKQDFCMKKYYGCTHFSVSIYECYYVFRKKKIILKFSTQLDAVCIAQAIKT